MIYSASSVVKLIVAVEYRRSTYNHLSSWLTDARNLTNPNTVTRSTSFFTCMFYHHHQYFILLLTPTFIINGRRSLCEWLSEYSWRHLAGGLNYSDCVFLGPACQNEYTDKLCIVNDGHKPNTVWSHHYLSSVVFNCCIQLYLIVLLGCCYYVYT